MPEEGCAASLISSGLEETTFLSDSFNAKARTHRRVSSGNRDLGQTQR